MEIMQAIRGRRSIRRFRTEPIPPETLDAVLDAARWAPYGTASDERVLLALAGEPKKRLVRFLSARLEEVLEAMAEGPSRRTLTYARSLVPVVDDAPVLVAVFTAVGREGPELSIASAACAVQNLMLAAHAHGLASCYMTGAIYLADEIAHQLGISQHRLVGLVPLGYPAAGGAEREQFPAVAWRGFGELDRGELPEADQPEVSAVQEARPGAGEHVLLITDTPDVDARITEVLRRAGYQVRVAGPADGLQAFKEQCPDLTIIDAILGHASGYALAERIRDHVEGPCPVIVATAAYDAADEEQALVAGASDVLTKPVRDHELLARVRFLADSRGLYEQLQERAEELERVNEELRELQQMRDDLTHMIVHDMRTPLTNIITGLQTVEAADYDDELAREFLPEAISAGLDLSDMVNNLLDISKMEAGEVEPEREELRVAEVVAEACERVDHLAAERGVELSADVEDGLELWADRQLVKRALVNLLGNAVKFTPDGGSVRVEAARADGATRLCVHDTGPGIPEDQQDRLFRKFSQLDTDQAKQGTGLGLAFVRMAVEAHGGEVWVESEVGEGSSFCFTIPQQPR
ncbi:MAG: nitroreductase family protein [Armatimonadota bacterium]